MDKQTVIGVFATKNQAQEAVNALQSAGYPSAQIDMMARDNYDDNSMRDRRDEGISGFFSSLFSDDDHDSYRDLHDTARRGNVVTVHTMSMDKAERAADILDEYGAINSDEASTNLRDRGVAYDDADTTLDVIKEDLQIGKQTVATGGVRLRSRVVNRPVEETLRLHEENVFVNRTPVDRPIDPSRIDTFKEGTVTMTETSEVPVVNKTARVVEQVSVGKQGSDHEETIRETVRETEVDVERIGANDLSDTDNYRNDGDNRRMGAGNGLRGAAAGAASSMGNAVSNTANSVGRKVDEAGDDAHNALDRDNDGEVIDLNDGDGRIG